MRIIHVAIPAVILGLVLANALFGHMIFGYAYDRTINKYSVYVHLQPEWESHPGNIIYDVTNVWSGPESGASGRGVSGMESEWWQQGNGGAGGDPDDISPLVTYNRNNLQYQNSKSYVELRHDFSDCESDWRPISYRYAVDAVRGWFELAGGTQVYERHDVEPAYVRAAEGDPYVRLFPNVPNTSYSDQMQAALVRDGYAQFIPACIAAVAEGAVSGTGGGRDDGGSGSGNDEAATGMSGAGVSYDYSVMVNDPGLGFDVYFARPVQDGSAHSFEFYDAPGCGAVNRNSFAGTCHGVEPGSGLLIILPDALEQSLTRVHVSMHERGV